MTRGRRRQVRLVAVAALLAATAAAALTAYALGSADRRGAHVIHVVVVSRLLHRRIPMTVVLPAGAGSGRPLLVFLHGRGGDQNSELSGEMFAALRALGSRAPAIAFPYGDDHSYWHDRRAGPWGAYVLREAIPKAIAVAGADPHRLAIGGISMGGFGAYDLAREAPGRFCAVGGHSAALWTDAGDTAPGAFDDAPDFTRHDVIATAQRRPGLYGRARLWLDGGDADPFHAADETFAAALGIHMHVWPGGHDGAYWSAHWGRYLGFYAAALARC